MLQDATTGRELTGDYLNEVTIATVEPCLADPSEWRLHAVPDVDLAEILPYLNAIIPGARYTHGTRTLSFRRQGMLVTVMPREVRVALVPSLDTGRALLAWLRETTNDAHARRAEIVPREGLQRLPSALDLYKLLPRTNCNQCGFGTCVAFALRLASGGGGLGECLLLQEPEFSASRLTLQAILGEP